MEKVCLWELKQNYHSKFSVINISNTERNAKHVLQPILTSRARHHHALRPHSHNRTIPKSTMFAPYNFIRRILFRRKSTNNLVIISAWTVSLLHILYYHSFF